MHDKHGANRLQQRQLERFTDDIHSYEFFNELTSPGLLDILEDGLPAHRERLFPPATTLSIFMAQSLSPDASCQAAVNRHAIERTANGLSACSTHTGGYCRARARLPLPLVQSLLRHTGGLMAASAHRSWRWRGRPIKLVDGSTITMADTPENQARYPQQSGQAPGLGFPIARVAALLCLGTGAVIDTAMGPYAGKGGSEQALFYRMLPHVGRGDVLIADRYYCSYFMIALLRARGADVIFQQHHRRITDFRRGKQLGRRDHVVVWEKPAQKPDWLDQDDYDAAPGSLSVREIRAGSKVLVTTLLSTRNASPKELKRLYEERWHVELDLRNIKTTLGQDRLPCLTPNMSEKQWWVALLAYNLIRLLMMRSAKLVDVLPRQLSFKHCLQLWLAWRQQGHSLKDDDVVALLILIAEKRVANRPGRIEPRAVKRRPKPFPLLTRPRHVAREHVRRHGHPKKLK